MNTQVDVNPKVLTWAREEFFGNASLADVAQKININLFELTKWEQDGKGVPFNALEILAKSYKRQTAVFFLENVPPRTKVVTDYRNIKVRDGNLSPDTLLAIRRTERYLSVARELKGEFHWERQYEWIKNYSGKRDDLKVETKKLREKMRFTINDQVRQHKKDDVAFRQWRNLIEKHLEIFTFQFSMPDDELDGFSYALDKFPFAIVLNNQKPYVRRIFTLFHELSHILKHTSGICDTDYSSSVDQFEIELECNSFAGEFLIPSDDVKSVGSFDEIFERARIFNVSGEVYLRRLFEENIISRSQFFEWLKEVHEKSNSFSRKKQKGGPSMLIQSKSSRGSKFFELVSSAAASNQISYSTVSDLLGLKAASIGV